jgi:hypothetical protein
MKEYTELPFFDINDLINNGFARFSSRNLGITTTQLSKSMLDDVVSMGIRTLPKPQKAENIGDYIQELYLEDQEGGANLTSSIYQLLPSLPTLWNFSVQDKLIEVLASSGLSSVTLGTVPVVRIDRPKTKVFATPWHQDYWFSHSAENSVVIWFPLTDLVADMGFLRAVPSPSNYGIVKFKEYKDGHEPFEPVKKIDESDAIDLECSFGEILIFYQSLLHRSGDNLSNKCRVSSQLRFNNMNNQQFPFSTFVPKHSEYVIQRQEDELNG